jgi:hypothetical protein
MSGVTVSVFPSLNARCAYQLHAHLAGPVTAPTADPAVPEVAITRVCRQIYAETFLLPLRSFTFHINSDGSFIEFLETLAPRAQDAIRTIQVSTPDANEGGTLLHCVTRLTGNDFNSQRIHLELLEWSSHLALDRLGGLRRVVIEENKQWVYKKADEHLLRDGIASCVRGRDIDIVLTKPTV